VLVLDIVDLNMASSCAPRLLAKLRSMADNLDVYLMFFANTLGISVFLLISALLYFRPASKH